MRATPACTSVGLNIELPFEQETNPYVDLAAALPLLLHPQGDVRALCVRLRRLSRRVRHARRALRGAHADPDAARSTTSPWSWSIPRTGRDWSTGSAIACWRRRRSRPRTSTLMRLTDDPAEIVEMVRAGASCRGWHRDGATGVRGAGGRGPHAQRRRADAAGDRRAACGSSSSRRGSASTSRCMTSSSARRPQRSSRRRSAARPPAAPPCASPTTSTTTVRSPSLLLRAPTPT